MGIESLLVDALVAASLVYAAWTLLPQMVRRALALGLLRLPLPRLLSGYLKKVAQASAGCHCSGCDHATTKGGSLPRVGLAGAQPLVFHPRKR
jgi:hypothetical protein